MAALRTAHTADLDAATLEAARALLDLAFQGHFSDHDWEHSLGGVHALVWEQGELVVHASVVQRRLMHQGRALRAGYVEGVGVRPDRRGRGHAAAMMEQLERVVQRWTTGRAAEATAPAARLYSGRGWMLWEGPTSALTPAGVVRTEDDDGSVFVLPVSSSLDLSAELTCDWREGDLW